MGVKSAGLALALFVASFLLYRGSPGQAQMCDSVYSLATTQCLLEDHQLGLGTHLPDTPEALSRFPGYQAPLGRPYHLRPLGAQGLCYSYPLGSSVLSLPLVALMRARGDSAFDARGTFDLEGETRMQCEAAAIVTAATVAGFYAIARTYLGRGAAAGVAALFATGSMAWSTLSRALWSHTWAVAVLTLIVLLLARVEAGQVELARPWVGFCLGTLAFWAWFARPHMVVQLAPAFVYLFVRRPRACALAALAYVGWRLALVAGTFVALGLLAPPTPYDLRWLLVSEDPPAVLAAYLISPSRGLLVFCPWVAVVAWVLVRRRAALPAPALALAAGAALAGTIGMLVAFKTLLGGHSYGPRYFADALPWLVLAGAQAFAVRPAGGARIALAVAFAWAILVHARGATDPQTWMWNEGGVSYELYAARAFDWRYPQWAAGLTFRVFSDGRREPLSAVRAP